MSEHRFALTYIFLRKDRIYDIRNTGMYGSAKTHEWCILRCGRQFKLRAWGYSVLYKKLSLYNDLHEISLSYSSTEKYEIPETFRLFH